MRKFCSRKLFVVLLCVARTTVLDAVGTVFNADFSAAIRAERDFLAACSAGRHKS